VCDESSLVGLCLQDYKSPRPIFHTVNKVTACSPRTGSCSSQR